MAICDTCGNDYNKVFTITRGEVTGTFESFECAIQAMAPACVHCARQAGQPEAVDRT